MPRLKLFILLQNRQMDKSVQLTKADLHIHTNRFSGCSTIDPVAALKKASDLGLNLIAFTDHGIRWPDDALKEVIDQSGISDLLVLSGQEAACYSIQGHFQGEFLVFGYPKSLGSNKSAEQLIQMVHDTGGVVIAAHPFKKQIRGDGFYGCGQLIQELAVDGLEIEHPAYGESERNLAKSAMKQKNIVGIGCSDAHELDDIGRFFTLLKGEINDIHSFCNCIRAGRVGTVSTIRNRYKTT
jgi:predicted metal-dependent phosphoesterase TrpH